jgi:hypothetical protein
MNIVVIGGTLNKLNTMAKAKPKPKAKVEKVDSDSVEKPKAKVFHSRQTGNSKLAEKCFLKSSRT